MQTQTAQSGPSFLHSQLCLLEREGRGELGCRDEEEQREVKREGRGREGD